MLAPRRDLAVAALAAIEAEGDVGAHRATAERAMRDYLAVAGRDAVDAARSDAVTAEARRRSRRRPARAASSPYDLLPPPDAARRPAAAALACPTGGAGSYARLDLRDGTLATAGAAPGSALARWLRDTLATLVSLGEARLATPGAMPVGVVSGAAPRRGAPWCTA